jgi:hypothetical protein
MTGTPRPRSGQAARATVPGSTDSAVRQALGALARLYPWSVEPSDDLCEAVSTLESDVAPEAVVRAGYGAGLLVGVVMGGLGLVTVGPLATVPGAALGLVVVHAGHSTPRVIARIRRTAALGDGPALVSRLVLRMRLSSTPERAAAFAAASGEGLLAARLATHVRRAEHTGRSGLRQFSEDWSAQFPPLARATALVVAAGSAPADNRERVLDRALGTVLDGTRERMREFAAEIRGPTTALYAFGVLLPTALVALLPAGAAAGVAVSPVGVVFLYNVVLPATLVAAGAWLLAQRPVAFPPPDLATHPEAETSTGAVIAGPVVGVAAWVGTAPTFPGWASPVSAVGLGCGVALWLRYRPLVGVYSEVHAAERELGDALALAGRRVAAGRGVETAVAETAGELDGPLGDAFRECARRQRQLQIGVSEGFLGPHGALGRVPSPRIRTGVALLALASHEGRQAGEALLSLSDHVEQLRRVRREANHNLAYVCRTLSSTAMLFGPLVAGATVALADGMGGEAFGEGEVSLGWLGAPVGVYVLVLAVVLTALSTALRRGLDGPLVGYRVGRALGCATVSYLCSYLLVGVIA